VIREKNNKLMRKIEIAILHTKKGVEKEGRFRQEEKVDSR